MGSTCRDGKCLQSAELEGKIAVGRHKRRWEDNIETDLIEIHYDSLDWIRLAQKTVQWGGGGLL
jgi:hypothetical protein